jgi:hypothetical protein
MWILFGKLTVLGARPMIKPVTRCMNWRIYTGNNLESCAPNPVRERRIRVGGTLAKVARGHLSALIRQLTSQAVKEAEEEGVTAPHALAWGAVLG